MTTYKLAVIPGDGVGTEVIPEGLKVLRRAGEVTGRFDIATTDYPWSCQWYLEHGTMMPADGIDQLRDSDAVYLGAVGFPGVPDHVSLWGLLLPIRQGFDLYINLRPAQLLEGIPARFATAGRPTSTSCASARTPRASTSASAGGSTRAARRRPPSRPRCSPGAASSESFAMRSIARWSASGTLASATKSNALNYTAVFWDEVVEEVGRDYPDVEVTTYHVDALAARMITAPDTLDVIVASNLFGDILTDIGGALQGSLGLPASANLNPERLYPSLFEPVHGSAPRRAGQGVANPMATIWAGAMLLDHIGEPEAGTLVMDALRAVARDGPRTKDLGGTATTREVGEAIAARVGAAG